MHSFWLEIHPALHIGPIPRHWRLFLFSHTAPGTVTQTVLVVLETSEDKPLFIESVGMASISDKPLLIEGVDEASVPDKTSIGALVAAAGGSTQSGSDHGVNGYVSQKSTPSKGHNSGVRD